MRSMTTKAPAKKAAKAPAKKAAPAKAGKAPAAPRIRSTPAPPATEEETPAAGKEPTITFHGRTFPVIAPNDEQMALLLDIVDWSRKLKTIQANLMALPEGTPDNHPEVVKGQKAIEQALRRIGRMNTIVETLIPADDFEDIQDAMAARQIPWQDFANLPYLILAAHNAAGLMVEANRAARRQQGSRAV